MFFDILHDRKIIALSGADVSSFLQGLVTNDVTALAQGGIMYAALLSPQGKFLHDFFLISDAERILLDVNKDRAADLIARFNIYKLRAQVKIEATDIEVKALFGSDNLPYLRDPRLSALGYRIYSFDNSSDNSYQKSSENYQRADYEAHRIALGVPDGAKDMHIDKSLPLELGLDKFAAISFSKGCYVGQEVTARSKFRGKLRKALYRVAADCPLPEIGSIITAGTEEIGELRSVSGKTALAVLNSEKLENLTTPLTIGNIAIEIV